MQIGEVPFSASEVAFSASEVAFSAADRQNIFAFSLKRKLPFWERSVSFLSLVRGGRYGTLREPLGFFFLFLKKERNKEIQGATKPPSFGDKARSMILSPQLWRREWGEVTSRLSPNDLAALD